MSRTPVKRKSSPRHTRTQLLVVDSDHLVINNGEHKIALLNEVAKIPDGLIDHLNVDQIPHDAALEFACQNYSKYPMRGFRSIVISRTMDGYVRANVSCKYPAGQWTDPISIAAWRAIMLAVTKIEFEGVEENTLIDDFSTSSNVSFSVMFPGEGNTIEEVKSHALSIIRRVEKRARAFHFVIAQEQKKFSTI